MKTSSDSRSDVSLNAAVLQRENIIYKGSGGVSENNRSSGFQPAFLDTQSGQIYLSRFADGRLAPIHLLSALPDSLLILVSEADHRRSIKETVISGFMLNQRFYTRAQAAEHMARAELAC